MNGTHIQHMMNRVQAAVAALNATDTDIQGITIRGSRPVIRVSRSAYCARLIQQGKASYVHTGHDKRGIFRQGVFELHGCRVVWPESLW